MKLSQSNTLKNLANAFATECQDGAKYQFIRQKAQAEGYENIGKICQQHATNEMTHAKVYFDFITNDCKDCVENVDISAGYPFKAGTLQQMLKMTAADELTQATVIYPNFAQVARDEGFLDIAKKFELIAEVERTHYLVLEQICSQMQKDCLYSAEKATKWVCQKCGHEDTKKSAWQVCPVCGSQQGNVELHLQS